jgi:hypothetical protein
MLRVSLNLEEFVKSLICLASLLAAVSFSTPTSASTLAYNLEPARDLENPLDRLGNELRFDPANSPLVNVYSVIAGVVLQHKTLIATPLVLWSETFSTSDELNVMLRQGAPFGPTPELPHNRAFKLYELESFSSATVIPLDLPSTFPMFLGACLGTAFLKRKRRRI